MTLGSPVYNFYIFSFSLGFISGFNNHLINIKKNFQKNTQVGSFIPGIHNNFYYKNSRVFLGRYTQPIDDPISFPPVNLTRVITPHYDALVLTVCINGFDVHKVLVDPSSADDLLHLPAFKQMRVPIDHFSSAGRVLSGFNGATTLTVGDIAFPVRAGPVAQHILFLVVEDLGPYNAILGQTWLHAMKAIPSTYHQTISYLTASGKGDLQGSHLAARQCYQLSLQGRE